MYFPGLGWLVACGGIFRWAVQKIAECIQSKLEGCLGCSAVERPRGKAVLPDAAHRHRCVAYRSIHELEALLVRLHYPFASELLSSG